MNYNLLFIHFFYKVSRAFRNTKKFISTYFKLILLLYIYYSISSRNITFLCNKVPQCILPKVAKMQIEKKLYSEQVIEIIKNDLLTGKLLPGDKVNEVHLAQRLELSRAPIREALCLLEREGLIVSHSSKGKFIKKLSEKEIYDSYATTGILEGYAVRKTFHLFKENDFAKLEKIITSIDKSGKTRNHLLKYDDDFHNLTLKYVDNTVLVQIARQLSRKLSSFLLTKYWEGISSPEIFRQRHMEVYDAIISGNEVKIEEAIQYHYISIANNVIELVKLDSVDR